MCRRPAGHLIEDMQRKRIHTEKKWKQTGKMIPVKLPKGEYDTKKKMNYQRTTPRRSLPTNVAKEGAVFGRALEEIKDYLVGLYDEARGAPLRAAAFVALAVTPAGQRAAD